MKVPSHSLNLNVFRVRSLAGRNRICVRVNRPGFPGDPARCARGMTAFVGLLMTVAAAMGGIGPKALLVNTYTATDLGTLPGGTT